MKIISVIVPVYKVEKFIHRCIYSILAQTFKDFELILVDDGSPDNCGKICDEYALKDNRIHVIHKENGGLSDARNAGIDWAFANSNSEWITFIDSDDWIHPKYLEALYNAVKKSGCEISICGFEETEGNNPNVDEYYKYAGEETIIVRKLISEAPPSFGQYKQASLEKILVDLFGRGVSGSIISYSEYRAIYEDSFEKYMINQPKMFRYARRRGIEKKIVDFIHEKTNITCINWRVQVIQ